MDNVIIDFLSQYIELTEEEKNFITNQNVIQFFPKGSILLSEGERARECYFILKGCIYSYYLINGDVKVTEFYTEQQPVTPISYTAKKPSEYYLECLEDTIVALGNEERNTALLKGLPRLAAIGGTVMQDQLADQRLKYDEIIKLSPEERYRNMQDNAPELLNRVPQYLIASYLGIQPESLSRIRKRLVK